MTDEQITWEYIKYEIWKFSFNFLKNMLKINELKHLSQKTNQTNCRQMQALTLTAIIQNVKMIYQEKKWN